MSKVSIDINFGYGIRRLSEAFVFERSESRPHYDTHIIYAQNGVMKSSFTKSIRDYTLPNTEVRDHIAGILGSCVINDEQGAVIPPEQIMSVPSFDNNPTSSERMSDLLVSESLKKRYDELIVAHSGALDSLLKKLKQVSRVKANIEPEKIVKMFCLSFGDDTPVSQSSFIHLARTYRQDIDNAEEYITKLPFKTIGEPLVLAFAKDNGNFLSSFMQKYDEVLKSSAYLRGEFGTKGAQAVSSTLDKEKFFSAEHTVTLIDKSDPENEIKHTVNSAVELANLLESDFDRVFEGNPVLKKQFQKVLKKLDQQNHGELKTILENAETRQVITLMANFTQFHKRLWYGYLKACSEELDTLLEVDKNIAEEVKAILEEAKNERTQWDDVVDTFNRRFRHMPFILEVRDKPNILLKGVDQVSLDYYYKLPSSRPKRIDDESLLLRCLSTGERKAFFLLNLLFDIKAREKSGEEQLIILDDIVDSFDFKNKYAFLEYIYELSKSDNKLRLIILTHNFDFFRLMQSRMFSDGDRTHCWFAERNEMGEVSLQEAGQFNFYDNTRKHAHNDAVAWLSLIPLARNLIEYSTQDFQNSFDYRMLTECLHLLDTTHTVQDVQQAIDRYTSVTSSPIQSNATLHQAFFDAADTISVPTPINLLHNRTVLAVACRLKAEEFMKSKLSSDKVAQAKSSNSNFTRELYEQYRQLTSEPEQNIATLDNVNLITPENIHINAFMYEPLIDMSQDELVDLYDKLKGLI